MDLAKRKLGIGGSDVAAILNLPGVSTFQTAVEIWQDKINNEVNEIEVRPDNGTSPMYFGKVFEDALIDAYTLVEKDVINYVVKGKYLNQFHHADYPWLIANVDGIVNTKEHGNIVLEVKYGEADFNDEWGESGTDQIPLKYICQVQHYMNVLNLPMAHVVAKIGFKFAIYKIPRRQPTINAMFPMLNNFWFENVQKRIPPEPSSLNDVKIIYPSATGASKEASDDQIKTIEEARLLRKEISQLQQKLDEKKLAIANEMRECSKLVSANQRLATFNCNKNGTRILRVS